jgi:hypothetical protein
MVMVYPFSVLNLTWVQARFRIAPFVACCGCDAVTKPQNFACRY